MTPKELFQKQTDLKDRLAAVTKSDWFSEVLLFVRAELVETANITPELFKGAKAFEGILMSLCDPEDSTEMFPGPQLHHDIKKKG